MKYPELLKAKKDLEEINKEIDMLLRSHNSLTKKELSQQGDTICSITDDCMNSVEENIEKLRANLKNHRKRIESRYKFVRRHYKMV
jgi:hypothetical protein